MDCTIIVETTTVKTIQCRTLINKLPTNETIVKRNYVKLFNVEARESLIQRKARDILSTL